MPRFALSALLLLSAGASVAGTPDAAAEVQTCRDWMAERTSADAPAVRRAGTHGLCADIGNGLTDAFAATFVAQLDAVGNDAPPQVVVRSLGGAVDPAMAMGEAIAARAAVVHAYGFCASSCANYLFLPAAERHVMEDAALMFHGGLVASSLDNPVLTEAGRARAAESLERQTRLMAQAGIDPDFFQRIDALDAGDAMARICPGKTGVNTLLLSSARLADAGAPLASNRGPDSQTEAERVLARYGLADSTCFWE